MRNDKGRAVLGTCGEAIHTLCSEVRRSELLSVPLEWCEGLGEQPARYAASQACPLIGSG